MALRLGDRGPEVTRLQIDLAAAGHDPGPPDGVYGPRTRGAVAAFQRAHGVRPDGVAGPATLIKLDEVLKGRSAGGGPLAFSRRIATNPRREWFRLTIDRSRCWWRVVHPVRGRLATVSAMARQVPGATAVTSGCFFAPSTGLAFGPVLINGRRRGWDRAPLFRAIDMDRLEVLPEGVRYDAPEMAGRRNVIAGMPILLPEVGPVDRDYPLDRSPRLGLGWSDTHIYLALCDGRRPDSAGATLEELADELRVMGATQAIALDGGGTAEMIWRGRIVNQPSDGRERPQVTALAFGVNNGGGAG